jgi:hypothetical protein
VIKLTVHESVEAALQKAFPKPAAAAKRALAKYISVVESMLFDALQRGQTPEQRKLGLYAISLDQLANKGGQIGPKKIRVHKWLTDNDWDIVQTVVKGTKFSGQNSQVKLTSLVTVQNNLQIPAASLSAATTDEEIDAYLSGDDVSNIALFDHLYPEYNLEWREDKLRQLFDWVPVDVESVKAYVYWLETESKMIQGPKKDLALRQALSILGIAAVTKGYYLQRKKLSPFGRTYYEGTSVQNVNKELRRAMLGNCWEYDIRSSVVAWKMGYARGYLAASGLDQDLKKSFPATLLYLEDKADFMATVRHYVFPESSPVPKDLRPKLLKQAFTAISFGARQTAKGWLDASGNWTNPALVEILQNTKTECDFLPTIRSSCSSKSKTHWTTTSTICSRSSVLICCSSDTCRRIAEDLAKPRCSPTFISTAKRTSWILFVKQQWLKGMYPLPMFTMPFSSSVDWVLNSKVKLSGRCESKQATHIGTSRPSRSNATHHDH